MKRALRHTALVLSTLLVVTACRASSVDDKPFVVADLFATPGKALATVEFSPTPETASTPLNQQPSPTPRATLPLPTVVVLQPTLPIGTPGSRPGEGGEGDTEPTATLSGADCATEPPVPFLPIWQNIAKARELLRCPVGEVQNIGGVFQFYEHGAMFWREQDRSIFIISDLAIRQGQETDSWWRVDDTFQEGEPEDDPGLQPPEGMRQPIRGFGKVWRSNAFVRDAIGWAATEEIPLTSLWLNFEGGWMMTGPNGAPIYVMIPSDQPPYSTGLHLGPLP